MEHELLAVFFTARSVSLVPFHDGDKLESRFVLEDPNAFAKAQRACENRIRTRDGRPTVEQEEAVKAARAKLLADREAADLRPRRKALPTPTIRPQRKRAPRSLMIWPKR